MTSTGRNSEEKPTAAAYDAVADGYDQWIGGGGKLNNDTIVGLLRDIRGTDMISLACGQGRDARLLASLGASVIGTDNSGRLLDLARQHEADEHRGITYRLDDAQTLATFADGSATAS